MDIRIARTDRAIEQAFMELREKNPLERIKIKDLCALACINKSTFYAHYEDIYALANALENKLVESILASVPHTHDDEALHQTDALTRELFQAFVQNQRAVNILFSGNRQGIFANSIEKGLRQRFEEADPTFAADLNRGILLSFCVQGCFYAFTNNSGRMDESKLVALLGAIAKAAQKIELYRRGWIGPDKKTRAARPKRLCSSGLLRYFCVLGGAVRSVSSCWNFRAAVFSGR